jgi:hypothetical protein
MNELYELKDMLVKELEEYGKKGDLSAGSLDIVDKLAHSVKNLCKVIEDMDEYSNYGGSYDVRMTDGMSYRRGGSYARGRNARRDSMGRYSSEGYSRAGDLAEQLRGLMREAPDEHIRQDMERLASKLAMM